MDSKNGRIREKRCAKGVEEEIRFWPVFLFCRRFGARLWTFLKRTSEVG